MCLQIGFQATNLHNERERERDFGILTRREAEKEKLGTLEVTVISAEGLTLSSRPVKKNAFVTVSTDPHSHASTRLDTDGGSYPRWDEKLSLALPPAAGFLAVEVRCREGSRLHTVGSASIPASDFLGGVLPADYLHFLSYRLRDSRGERNGIVNLSIRVVQPPPPLWAPGKRQLDQVREVVALGIPVRHPGQYGAQINDGF
ncbi:hypothetical protein Taro_050566 [Colocasia esculenta]|uniref:C2 domain-containing protein n=1 Tax=Colocasia esculenta TaxID=4460 RepID=A0A843XEC3_COLES|nr:hypothetical protein [Colocasia esculenta]